MNQLIWKINQLTIELGKLLEEEKYDQLERVLDARQAVMDRVDVMHSYDPNYHYGEEDKKLLKETQILNEELHHQFKQELEQARSSLVQMKQNRILIQKYSPYSKQTAGIFFDQKE